LGAHASVAPGGEAAPYLDYGRNLRMSFKPYNKSESQPDWVVPLVVIKREYRHGFVERVGYFPSRSSFAIPRPSSRRSSSEMVQDGAVRSPESVRASKTRLRRLIYSLAPDRMLTLTYAENMTDFDQARADLKLFKDSFSKRYPGSSFVAVPERQQRGAWHWHIALRGYFSIHRLRKWWPHGYARIDYRKRQMRADAAKIGMYLSKYLSKDLGVLGRAAYSVCNRKVLDKPSLSRITIHLPAIKTALDHLKLEALFLHGAMAAYAFQGVFWRIDHVENSSP
jgi:hypothetical protein